ncbi:MAG: tRNA (N(6)-L-threonylcarbamoyladenosine(37)-C(2))-methylthiotransferase MtaB [Spirochaetes bacterium]|nr:tRNA (N(6)-L-threonylcarbamoyladenosine(37)-C(2))-methylthiotransferase MtaB [Spirochaetota bacterium]
MQKSFIANNFDLVQTEEKADIYVINTCTVTTKSDTKSRKIIRKVKKNNPDSLVIVTGCYAKTDKAYLMNMPEIDLVLGNKINIVDQIISQFKLKKQSISKKKSYAEFFRSRGFLKVQDGCDNYCTYCKVPFARGEPYSKPIKQVKEEIKQYLDLGYEELILSGLNLGCYDDNGINLTGLLKHILNIDSGFRLRISSLEPQYFNPELIDLLLHEPRICPHYHIPLQHASDKILKLMERKYNNQYYYKMIDKINKNNPHLATDIIIGFPSETDKDYHQLIKMISDIKFASLHIFPFQRRKGTKAYFFKDKIPQRIRDERCRQLAKLAKKLNYEYRQKYLQKTLHIVLETNNKKRSDDSADNWCGVSENYIRFENISIKNVSIENQDLTGKIIKVQFMKIENNHNICHPV